MVVEGFQGLSVVLECHTECAQIKRERMLLCGALFITSMGLSLLLLQGHPHTRKGLNTCGEMFTIVSSHYYKLFYELEREGKFNVLAWQTTGSCPQQQAQSRALHLYQLIAGT